MANVEMPNYPDNSDSGKARESMSYSGVHRESEQKTGKASIRRKSAFKRASESIFENDGRTVLDYLIKDVLLPAAKDTVFSLLTSGLDMFLWGDGSAHASYGNKYTNYGNKYTNYGNKYASAQVSRPVDSRPRTLHYDELLFDDRKTAVKVLDNLRGRLEHYPYVRVADLFDEAEVTCDFTYNKWGWYDLSNATVRMVRGGKYMIVGLPKPEPIDD